MYLQPLQEFHFLLKTNLSFTTCPLDEKDIQKIGAELNRKMSYTTIAHFLRFYFVDISCYERVDVSVSRHNNVLLRSSCDVTDSDTCSTAEAVLSCLHFSYKFYTPVKQ